MITKVILTYLQQHRRLIIPGLGAFIVKGHDGKCDNILFSEILKGDDGILKGLLLEQGLRDIEVVAMIDRFIFEVKHATTENGEKFIIEGVGFFDYSPSGKPLFTYSPECKITPEVEAKTEVEVETKEETTQPDTETKVEPEIEIEPENIEEVVAPESESEPEPEVIGVVDDNDTTTENMLHNSQMGTVAQRRNQGARQSAESYRAKRIRELYENPPKQSFRDDDPSLEGLQYGKKVKQRDTYTYTKVQKPKTDKVLLAAVVAAIIAVGAIAYGYYVSEIVPRGGFELFWSDMTGGDDTIETDENSEVEVIEDTKDTETTPSKK